MPFVTLIIPIYNAERYLRRCLDSVVEQTYADMEVLLMNDGSTDGSLAICREYEEKDLRFRTIDKENTGDIGYKKSGNVAGQRNLSAVSGQ